MTTFKQFLSEKLRWQKSLFYIITSDYIQKIGGAKSYETVVVPLKHSFLSKYFGPLHKKAIHISSLSAYKDIKNLEGKKSKHISTMDTLDRTIVRHGMWGGSGAGFVLEGDMLINSQYDVWSVPTKQGTRVIELANIEGMTQSTRDTITNRYTKEVFDALLEVVNKYKINEWPGFDDEVKLRTGYTTTQNMMQLSNYFERIDEGYVRGIEPKHEQALRRIKNEFITKFMDFWSKEFASNKELWKQLLYTDQREEGIYNEIVLSNFSIKSIIVLVDEDTDSETFQLLDWIREQENVKVVNNASEFMNAAKTLL